MTTNPDVLRLAREIAKVGCYETDDGVMEIIIAAIERTTQLAVNYAAYQGSSLLYGLKALDHLRQSEKDNSDAD